MPQQLREHASAPPSIWMMVRSHSALPVLEAGMAGTALLRPAHLGRLSLRLALATEMGMAQPLGFVRSEPWADPSGGARPRAFTWPHSALPVLEAGMAGTALLRPAHLGRLSLRLALATEMGMAQPLGFVRSAHLHIF